MSDLQLPNFYAMKQKTHQSIFETVDYLAKFPEKRVLFSDLVFEFLKLYGIGEIGVKNLLKPFLETKKVFLVDGCLVGPQNSSVPRNESVK